MLLWMTLITGLVYPFLITLTAQLMIPYRANGSFISVHQKIIGSKLIGQKFTADKYFWGRPSASDYNPQHSGGSNLGPISATLQQLVKSRKEHLEKTRDPDSPLAIPSDLLFASGSGLDPHITLQAVQFQKARVIKARKFDKEMEQKLEELIQEKTAKRIFGFFGTPCLNVLELNIALDLLYQPLVENVGMEEVQTL